jgi:hypothetical protein
VAQRSAGARRSPIEYVILAAQIAALALILPAAIVVDAVLL